MSTTKKLIAIHFFTLLTFICNAQNGVTIYDSILSGGLQRKYRLYVPNSYNASNPAPLVFNLHGYNSNSSQQLGYTNFLPIADTAKFLVVHPDGTFSNGSQYWNAGFGGTVNDVQFISNLLDSIKATYNIDLNSVYSCGMSNGGIMSYYLACNLSNRIAAIASVTGDMLNSWYASVPNPPRPFPVMEIHGTADGTVPYLGNANFAHIDSVVKKWRKYNNCTPTAIITNVPDINTSDGCTAVNYRYANGTNGAEVELYKINGGSHSWPGAFPFIANTNEDFKASVEIWRFFRKYKLNQFIANVGVKKESADQKITVYPNPASSVLNFGFDTNSGLTLHITDITGKIIIQQELGNTLDVSSLKTGVYFISIVGNDHVHHSKFIKL
ncbi:MAG: T9SS type A sorting domain-containing protein [Bacteroidetes bacterium]|nr:T9SS type A sorting domain-containing protein [Bacteroidota bacterium]